MCRLLGVVSTNAASLPSHLGACLTDFTALSGHHKDGWGIAWWDDHERLHRERAAERASTSRLYASTVKSVRTSRSILHLRHASAGLPLTTTNSHPFLAPGVAFAHNGYATPASALDVLVRREGGTPSEGSTDSERYFHLVLALMERMPPERALLRAARLIALATTTEALNALLLTRDALFAIRADWPAVAEANGTDPSDYRLHFTNRAGASVVASTGWETEPEQWKELRQWQVLELRRDSTTGEVLSRVHEPS